jgi:predicted N-formylglutamate amidohydrolase
MKLIITCEHGGNEIPKSYQSYFKEHQSLLNTHGGYDLGVFDVFQHLESLSDYSKFSKKSRLLIELNRSLHHPNLFSEVSDSFSKAKKKELINTLYVPYRNEVESIIKQYIEAGEHVIHLSLHSFTPIYNNVERSCDIGLLYDSKKSCEKVFCKGLKEKIADINANINVRYNYPYLGKADGFTTYLRKQFPENYMGVEIEINQKFSKNNVMDKSIKQTLYQVLSHI